MLYVCFILNLPKDHCGKLANIQKFIILITFSICAAMKRQKSSVVHSLAYSTLFYFPLCALQQQLLRI